ncbi:class I SAM-dependent methyltransferase [Methylomagnum sp.]
MSVTLRDYLDIKFALDERSLSPAVKSAFFAALRDRAALACLDIGTGTGASIWRLLNADLKARLEITAVDRDQALLELAHRRTVALLGARGFKVTASPGAIKARQGKRQVAVEFIMADLEHFEHDRLGHYDAVIAHAVMNLLPPQAMAGRISGWLKPRGVFYATLNYDGGTSLLPIYRDQALEDRVFAAFDAAMERRRVWDQSGGGARSGRRLHAALLETGLEVLAYGSSDWNLTPESRRYRDRESVCLTELLELMRNEAAQSGQFVEEELEAWYRARLRDVNDSRLGLVVHQLDFLAEKPG